MVQDFSFSGVKKIVVIAPHPDDESLGCGGLIAKHAAAGREFHTVFVTDGGASHPGSLKWPRDRIALRREQEAAAALHLIGIGSHPRTFLRLRDADMPLYGSVEWSAAVKPLAAVFRTFQPELVLLPWRRDPHRDHRDSWRLTMDAILQSAARVTTLEYAIWLEEHGVASDYPRAGEVETMVFDVAAVVQIKRAAVAAHLSQTTDLIDDDPSGFRLTAATITRLTGPYERYWRSADEAN